jgi:preprotein translocase subunit SecE
MNLIQKPVNFLKEVRVELSKVAWSTRQELMGSTVVVIATTAIMAVFIGLLDIMLSRILSFLFK